MSDRTSYKKPELMAPAGDILSLRAAIDAGADAVYFGIASMNMRANAKNFEINEMSTISELCHQNNVKAYLALNTIIFDNEAESIEKLIIEASAAKIDAIICWDFSIIELAIKHGVNVFISTQMSVANAYSLAFLYKHFGIKRFVLARECSLADITSIKAGLKKLLLPDSASHIEIEVFAHGAMCVSVSGRCFMSQFVFNSSANRGECRQPCRREFEIRDTRDGKEFLIGQNYIMSPKDLCSLPFLEQILDTGIESLKIEGRGRSPEYVSIVTACYREFIDFYYSHRNDCDFIARLKELKKCLMEKLNSVFNRGFSSGFFFGRNIEEWSGGNGSQASHRKVHIGVVTNFFKKVMVAEVKVEASEFIKGDELMFQGTTTGVVSLRVESIEEDFKSVDRAKKNSLVGVRLSGVVRENDQVYIMLPVNELEDIRQ